jgi:hypothetical protein
MVESVVVSRLRIGILGVFRGKVSLGKAIESVSTRIFREMTRAMNGMSMLPAAAV